MFNSEIKFSYMAAISHCRWLRSSRESRCTNPLQSRNWFRCTQPHRCRCSPAPRQHQRRAPHEDRGMTAGSSLLPSRTCHRNTPRGTCSCSPGGSMEVWQLRGKKARQKVGRLWGYSRSTRLHSYKGAGPSTR